MPSKISKCIWIAILIQVLMVASSYGDEGMWLFNDLPKDHLKSQHGFEPTEEWANHLMLSSVRFNSGGSASFVSSNGLVLTTHHVAADTLAKISTAENNYQTNGFLAKSQGEEIKAPDLELNQLVAIRDVTDQVNAAVTGDMAPADAFKARRAVQRGVNLAKKDRPNQRHDSASRKILFGQGGSQP